MSRKNDGRRSFYCEHRYSFLKLATCFLKLSKSQLPYFDDDREVLIKEIRLK